MQFTIITLFPQMFESVFNQSIMKRAQEQQLVNITYVDLREFGIGKHRSVDDKPYGGGTGMILRVDVLEPAIVKAKKGIRKEKVVLLDPKGKTFNQETAKKWSKLSHLILLCGRYEGFDSRIKHFVDEEVSIGDFILSGGEIGSMVVVDSIIRLIPRVLKKKDAVVYESFSKNKGHKMLEYPQYTRPYLYKRRSVPKVLLSGDPEKINQFRQKEAIKITKAKRPDIV